MVKSIDSKLCQFQILAGSQEKVANAEISDQAVHLH